MGRSGYALKYKKRAVLCNRACQVLVDRVKSSFYTLDGDSEVAIMATMATTTKTRTTYVPAKEAKNRFGEMLEAVQRHNIIITKNNRPVAELRRFSEKTSFEMMENQILLEKTLRAMKNSKFIGHEKSLALIQKYRNA